MARSSPKKKPRRGAMKRRAATRSNLAVVSLNETTRVPHCHMEGEWPWANCVDGGEGSCTIYGVSGGPGTKPTVLTVCVTDGVPRLYMPAPKKGSPRPGR